MQRVQRQKGFYGLLVYCHDDYPFIEGSVWPMGMEGCRFTWLCHMRDAVCGFWGPGRTSDVIRHDQRGRWVPAQGAWVMYRTIPRGARRAWRAEQVPEWRRIK